MTNALLLRRRGMMGSQGGGAMVKIEYLERSSGSVFIDVPVIAQKGVRVEVDFQKTTTGNNFVFGAYVSNSVCIQCYTGSAAAWRYGTGYDLNNTNNTNRHVAIMDNGIFILDGVTQQTFTVSNFNTNLPITLFGRNSSGGFVGKIFAAKITDVDNTLYDLIPVRVGTVGYMYDRVSGQLFGNLGTDDFILGPDVQ